MHEKRLTAPKTWKINRKKLEWIKSLEPGTHSKEQGVPLLLILRNVLKLVRDKKEAKALMNSGEVKVDGEVRKKVGFPVGILDVISVGNQDFRVIIKKGSIQAISVKDEEKKIAKIENKKELKGEFQYGFHDGKTLKTKKEFKRGSSLLLKLPNNKISEEIPLKEGSIVLVYKGGHKGKVAEVTDIRKMKLEPGKVKLKHNGEEFETLLEYVIAVGKDEPKVGLKGERK